MFNTKKFNISLKLSLMALAFVASGCKNIPAPGNYNGNISTHQIPHIMETEKTPVEVVLTYKHHHLTAAIFSPGDHSAVMKPMTISQKNGHTIELVIPDYSECQGKPLLLTKKKTEAGTCYQSSPGDSPSASLCFNPDNFVLDIHGTNSEIIHLYATKFTPARELSFEAPQSLTVSQGVDRILSKNYDVLEAQQSLLRANAAANRAYLNFIPHTSVGGGIMVGAVILGEIFEINRPINDLISFIFPGRWLKARALTWQARAERITNTLFKINMGTSVQTQSIAFQAHKNLRDNLQILQTQLTEVLVKARELYNQKRLDANSILTIEIALSDLNINFWQAQNQFIQDRIALSQTLGFENPETIQDMALEEETTPLESIPALNDADLLEEKKRYAELAVNNSFELRQLEYLHKSAVLNEKNVYLNWLDVYATMDLGFNLIADARLAKSMIKSVEIKSEKTRQSLIAKAYNLLRNRNLLRQSFDVMNVSLIARQKRLNLLFDRLKIFAESTLPTDKLTVQASDIRGSVRDVAAGMIGYYSSKAATLIDQASLDRLALQGVYEKFLPHLDGNEVKN